MIRTNDGHVLRSLRKHQGLTQHKLAELSGVSRASIADMERGYKNYRIQTLRDLLPYLGVSGSTFMKMVEELDEMDAEEGLRIIR